MKKTLMTLLVTVGLFTAATHAQKNNNQFVLKGKVAGQNDGLLYLYYNDNNNKRIKDSCVLQNGIFSFKGNISEPTMAYLQLKEEKRNELNSGSIFLEPSEMNADIKLNDFRKARITGS